MCFLYFVYSYPKNKRDLKLSEKVDTKNVLIG